jgi:hypothetical protein
MEGFWLSNKILASWPISILVALYVNYLKLDKSGIATVMAVPVICSLLIALYFILKTVPLSPDNITKLSLGLGYMLGCFAGYFASVHSVWMYPTAILAICLAIVAGFGVVKNVLRSREAS